MTERKLTFREQMSGFPVWQMVVINVIRFAEPIAFTSLFPYVYFMIRDFGIAKTESEVSKYSGYLSASFAFCQFLFSIHWGKLADRIGRKPVLIIGLSGTSISLLIFGFSKNFYMALFARSLMGALNGNVAVIRTMLGEIATERRHQAIAFSTLPLIFNVGAIIGPLIGGNRYLTRPKETSPYLNQTLPTNHTTSTLIHALTDISSFTTDDAYVYGREFVANANTTLNVPISNGTISFYENFISHHPYALSNVVISIFLWCGILVGIFFLEETHYKFKNRRDLGIEIGDRIRRRFGYVVEIRPWNLKNEFRSYDSDEDSPLIYDDTPQQIYSSSSAQSTKSIDSVGPISRRMSIALMSRHSSVIDPEEMLNIQNELLSDGGDTSMRRFFANFRNNLHESGLTPAVLQTILSNFILSLHCIVYDEFLPVFMASDFLPDELDFPWKISGGFGFSSDYIGSLLSITGIIGVVIILIVFPFVDRNYNPITTFRFFQTIFPVVYLAIPYVVFTKFSPFPSWTPSFLIYLLSGVKALAASMNFPIIMVLIHQAAPRDHRAFINGSTISASALARCIGPVIWGYLMSLSESLGKGWMSWWILAAFSLNGAIQSYFISESKPEEDTNIDDSMLDEESIELV